MSEQLKPTSSEQLAQPEAADRQRENLEKLQQAGQQAEREHASIEVDSLAKTAETQAISGKEVTVGEQQEDAAQTSTFGTQRKLKADAYKRTLSRTRQQLKIPDRILSKITHQPVIDAVSNVAGKTVARPSGILGGSLCALIGSAWLLYASKHVGFNYNYLAFLLLIIGGFFFGLTAELIIRTIARLRS